ncbi:MAG: VWA domain-containing protein, partial [Rhodocyclaceae bacterium]|nr:VWA domain-containing protein [Rhodocyclaceae bacterium]
VLLDLTVEIGARHLKGTVVEKRQAEERYEDALQAGDAAVMLEEAEPGLYTMNVGNVLPQEVVKITFRYAMLYRWAGERLRFFLPTTIAPRYGRSHFAPHQTPEVSLTVENRFSLRVEVCGALREAQFACPSHEVALHREQDKVVISLAQEQAVMDRDFVLNVKVAQAARSFVLCGQDGEGIAAMASFQPFFPGLQQPHPLNLAIVVDCSGSMSGESMAQAKQALEGILESMQPHDCVTMVAFGSTTKVFANHALPCNQKNLARARRFAKALDADLGGTEIGAALQEAYAILGTEEPADVFLITDGEVYDWQTVVRAAKQSGHRVFTVGVGSAVSEAFMRELATRTGGACELVSPCEGMAERVLRHFERMRAPRARRATIRWPEGAQGAVPAQLGAVYEGDTVIACAQFDATALNGAVALEVETEQGEVTTLELPLAARASAQPEHSTVARLAAAERLKTLDKAAGTETALRYQLVSPWSNWLVIAERAEGEKAQDMPSLRKVPHTLAAGWGGTASTQDSRAVRLLISEGTPLHRTASTKASRARRKVSMDSVVVRSCCRAVAAPAPTSDIPDTLRRLLALIASEPDCLDGSRILDLLKDAALWDEFAEVFRLADDLGLDRETIATIAIAKLLDELLADSLGEELQDELAALQLRARQALDALDVRQSQAVEQQLEALCEHWQQQYAF